MTEAEMPALLCVDDDRTMHDLVGHSLKSDRVRVDHAFDGIEAVAMFAASSYGIVLMDIEMPLQDGLAATREIRRLEREAGRTPAHIVVVSALSGSDMVSRSIEAGADAHIAKPVNLRSLRNMIREQLERQRTGSVVRTVPASKPAEVPKPHAAEPCPPEDGAPLPDVQPLVELAATVCGRVAAAACLFGETHCRWLAQRGMTSPNFHQPESLAERLLSSSERLVEIEDLQRDAAFARHPLVTSEPGLRSLAASALIDANGHVFGCVLVGDRKVGALQPAQREALRIVGHQIAQAFAFQKTEARIRSMEQVQRDRELREQGAQARKADYMSTLSHEIRTPLNAIIGMSSLLADTELSVEQHDFVQTVRINCEHLLSLINDVLDISKIESGNLQLEARAFELEDWLEDSLDLVSVKATEKGVRLGYTIEAATPHILRGDLTRLRQVLANLLSNAVKFTAEGHVHVSISAEPRVDGKAEEFVFSVRVSDTGIGIAPEVLPRLFSEYAQADASISRQYGGTGLGLHICKRLVELMHGEITAESTVGVGSTFAFRFPAQVLPERRTQPRLAALDLTGCRVLSVDDNQDNLRITDAQLRSWGAQVECVDVPERAIARIAAGQRFDLLVLDFNLPGMTGLQLAARLREEDPEIGRRIVILSSSILTPAQRRESVDLVSSVLTRPVKRALLRRAIDSAVGGAVIRSAKKPDPTPQAPVLPLRVLIAEDFDDNIKLAVHMLRKLGHSHIDVVMNGADAFSAVERRDYDVVLMDAVMPGLDGLEATRRIRREIPEDRQPRIVAMTAGASDADRRACIDAGMDFYITKPVRIQMLREVLQQIAEAKAKNSC